MKFVFIPDFLGVVLGQSSFLFSSVYSGNALKSSPGPAVIVLSENSVVYVHFYRPSGMRVIPGQFFLSVSFFNSLIFSLTILAALPFHVPFLPRGLYKNTPGGILPTGCTLLTPDLAH